MIGALRTTLQAVGLVGLLALSGCTPSDEEISLIDESADAPSAAEVEQAERLARLERAAYASNTLLEFENAERAYREASRIARELFPDDRQAQAEQTLHLALNLSNLGDYDTADRLFAQTMPVVKGSRDLVSRGKPDLFYSQHQMNQQRYREAKRFADSAVKTISDQLARLQGDEDAASSAEFFEGADGSLIVTEEAEATLNELDRGVGGVGLRSTLITDEGRLQLQRAHAYYVGAAALQALNDTEAEEYIAKARADLEAAPPGYAGWLRGQVAVVEAEGAVARGDYDAAVTGLSRAAQGLQQAEANTRPEALMRLRLAEVLVEAGQRESALSTYREAMAILDTQRRGVPYDRAASYFKLLMPSANNRKNKSAQAEFFLGLQQIQTSATAATLEQLSARLASGSSEASVLIRQVQDLEREVNKASARLDRIEASDKRDVHTQRVAEQRLTDAQDKLATARLQLQETAPTWDLVIDQSVPLSRLQNSLAEDEIVAVINLGSRDGLVTLIGRSEFRAYNINLTVGGAASAVRAIRRAIDGSSIRRFNVDAASLLHELLFEPGKELLAGRRHLVVAPTESLLSLPFDLLIENRPANANALWVPSGGKVKFDYSGVDFLGKRLAITTAVSPSSFVLTRAIPKSDAARPFKGYGDFSPFAATEEGIFQVFEQRGGDLDCAPSLARVASLGTLEGTRVELEEIASVLPVTPEDITMGEAFTDTAVMTDPLDSYQTLHLATHGLLARDPACLPQPALVTSLEFGEASDALLEEAEILDLNLNAEMVVLSACDTGGGGALSAAGTGFRTSGGESLSGLARAFFFAGARSLVVSHWSVDDNATQKLMRAFYSELASTPTIGIADAKRSAQSKLLADPATSHPFYWSAFAVIGDGERRPALGPSSLTSVSAALGLGLNR